MKDTKSRTSVTNKKVSDFETFIVRYRTMNKDTNSPDEKAKKTATNIWKYYVGGCDGCQAASDYFLATLNFMVL